MGGGSSGPTQTSSTVTQSNIPEYARPYVENMMGATQRQLFTGTDTPGGFDPETGQATPGGFNITGFQPYKAYGGTYDASGKQTSYDAGKSVSGFQPLQQQAQQGVAGLQVPWQIAGGALGSMDVANQSNVGGFQNQVGGYMSPYMQNVTDIQKREAQRQSGMQGVQQQAQATGAGALGGSRDAIMRAERERNLGMQMNDIQAQGSQAAYQSAQQQYNQNLQNQLAGYGQSAALANQGLQAQQGIYGLQNQMGQQQQSLEQQKINQAMQDYANAQQYPMMQLGSMSNMLRGLPMQATSTQQYQAQANPITQGIGLAGAGASLYNAYNTGKPPGGAEGGLPSEFNYASGGITSVPRYDVGGQVMSQLQNMDDEALKHEAEQSPSPEIKRMAQAILRQRQAGMNPSPQMEGTSSVDYNANYAGGGIIAFGKGEVVPKLTTVALPMSKASVDQPIPKIETEDEMFARLARDEDKTEARLARENDPKTKSDRAALAGIGAGIGDIVMSPAKIVSNALGDVTSGIKNLGSRAINAGMGRKVLETDSDYSPNFNLSAFSDAVAGKPEPRRPSNLGDLARGAIDAESGGKHRPTLEQMKLLAAKRMPADKETLAAETAKPGTARTAVAKPAPVAVAKPSAITSVPVEDAVAPADQTAAIPTASGLPAEMETERARLVELAGKTQKEYYDEAAADRKALKLDNSEARQQYMTDAMAQKANLKDEADRQKYMRMAEFFASWGSTPGNTLVAGMTALKNKIPDMISDAKDQKKYMAEANKLIYDLGEATRQENLGNWDKAASIKQNAAKIAEQYNQSLVQYAATTEGANIRARSDAAIERSRAQTSREVEASRDARGRAEVSERAAERKELAEIRARANKFAVLERAQRGLGEFEAKLTSANAKDPAYIKAVGNLNLATLKADGDKENEDKKAAVITAQNAVNKFHDKINDQLVKAKTRITPLEKEYYGDTLPDLENASKPSAPPPGAVRLKS